MARAFIIFMMKLIFGLISRRRITGMENLPQNTPVIVTSNHIGFLDGIMIPSVPVLARHPNLIVIVAEKYELSPLFSWWVNKLDFMFIDRFNPDVGTLRKVILKLKQNGLMIIAPEGTRSPNASLIEGKTGAAYLAAKTNAKILPIAMTGTEDSMVSQRLKKFRRLDVSIKIGKPFSIPPIPREGRDEYLKKYTDEIMCQIAALLPPSYRGIYADHPRLMELLETT